MPFVNRHFEFLSFESAWLQNPLFDLIEIECLCFRNTFKSVLSNLNNLIQISSFKTKIMLLRPKIQYC